MLKNKSNLYFFFENIVYWKSLVIFYNKQIPYIKKIVISSSKSNSLFIEENVIAYIFYFLEVFIGQKPSVSKIRNKSVSKNFSVTGRVTLFNSLAFNFLEFFIFFIKSNLDENFIKIVQTVSGNGNVVILLKDITTLPGMEEDYGHSFAYSIKIDIIMSNTDKKKTLLFFKELGLIALE